MAFYGQIGCRPIYAQHSTCDAVLRCVGDPNLFGQVSDDLRNRVALLDLHVFVSLCLCAKPRQSTSRDLGTDMRQMRRNSAARKQLWTETVGSVTETMQPHPIMSFQTAAIKTYIHPHIAAGKDSVRHTPLVDFPRFSLDWKVKLCAALASFFVSPLTGRLQQVT
eukprot:scaffold425_cov373-Pinguiococcus_pyrenoidosus.AAC.2